MKQWLQEQKDDDREYRTGDYQRGESGSCNGAGFFFVSCAHFQVVIGGASDSQEQCGCSGYDGYRKCDVCGRVSKHSYALADEDLVNDVVECADQHADDGGNGEFGDQAAYGGGSQRVFGLGSGGLVFQWGFLLSCFLFMGVTGDG